MSQRDLNLLQAREGFIDHPEFVVKQTNTFTKKYSNSYLTSQTDPSLLNSTVSGLGVWDPNTRQVTKKDIELKKLYTSVDTSKQLQGQAAQCAAADIDSLIGSQSLDSKLRCGWIYKKGTPGSQPQVSQGVLGTRNGPSKLTSSPNGTYYWNLDEAKKQIMKDRCGSLVNCANLGTSEFIGCAFSSTRGVGVPVDSKGNLLYPRDPGLSAPVSSLVRNPSSCPAPPSPSSPQYAYQQSRDSCMPLPNGKLSRDCMLQQITAAGCKQDGTLYQSLLNDSQGTNFAAGLENSSSYKKYQQFAQVPLSSALMKDGATTKDIALNNFKELNKQSQLVNQSGLSFASRDLCLKKGQMDSYNFCNELSDASTTPFNLQCLQELFRRMGGQPAGYMYPTMANKASYDALSTWSNVKAKIQELVSNVNASVDGFVDRKTQRSSMINLLGITPEPLDNSYIAGDVRNPGEFFDSGAATQRFRLWINKLLAPNFPATFLADAKSSFDEGNQVAITVTKLSDGSKNKFPLTSFVDGGYYWQVESTGKDAYQYGQIYITGDNVLFTLDVEYKKTSGESPSASAAPANKSNYSKIVGKNVLTTPLCENGNVSNGQNCAPLEIKNNQTAANEKCDTLPSCDGYMFSNNTYQLRSKVGNPNTGQVGGWPQDWYLKVKGRCSNFMPNTNVPTPACPPGSDRCYKPNLDEAQAVCDSVPSCTAVVLDNNFFESRKGVPESTPGHYTWSCKN